MSGLLTNLVTAQLDASVNEIDGKTLSRPTLLVTDGLSLTYGADVDIGLTLINPDDAEVVVAPLRNVPIAAGNKDLIYADAGAPVHLRRSFSGRWEIVGFTKRRPGTYTRTPVSIPSPAFGPIPYTVGNTIAIGLTARALTFGELATLGGGFGTAPFGLTGVFRDGVLIETNGV